MINLRVTHNANNEIGLTFPKARHNHAWSTTPGYDLRTTLVCPGRPGRMKDASHYTAHTN